MSRRKQIWIHIASWLLVFGYMVIGTYWFPQSRQERDYPAYISLLHASYTVALMATFYFCYLLVYPRFLRRSRVAVGVMGVVISPFVFVLFRGMLEELLYPVLWGFRNYGAGTTVGWYIIDNVFRGLPVIALSAAIWGAQRAYAKEVENRQLRTEKQQAELAFLKTQINPHFLFNTLNYMYSVAYPVSERLGNALIRLSQLMRYMLTETRDDRVPLDKEVEYLRNYIEVYRMLYEGEFYVDFTVEGETNGISIASLLLIPFFENACKHGVVNDPAQPVWARLVISGKQMDFMMRNAIHAQQKDHTTGIGLPNVQRRLALLYPGRHELSITNNGSEYETRLSILL